MVAVVAAGDTASVCLEAFGWRVFTAEPTVEGLLAARRDAEAADRHVVAVCSGAAAPLGAALATEGALDAVVSVGPLPELSAEILDHVRTPWLVLGREEDGERLDGLEIALEKAAVPGAVVRYRTDVTLDEPDARARAVTWIEHWAD